MVRGSIKWKVSYVISYPIFRFVLGVREFGRENVPLQGPVIIASNHRSAWDPPVLAFASPREIHFIAKSELFNPILSPFIRFYNAHPIIRSAGAKGALLTALRLLMKDLAILIFPEGTRNRTESPLLTLKKGIEWLAYREEIYDKVAVVPTYLERKRWGFNVYFNRAIYPREIKREDFLGVLKEGILKAKEKKEVGYGI